MSKVRIAAIYWQTSSVGGINSELQYYKQAAESVGDQFDILRSTNGTQCDAVKFPKIKRQRGGDTYIDLDGSAGHHVKFLSKTLKFLRDNYDAMFFVSLVPHPNKQYGYHPEFLPLFQEVDLPKAASISDGYWHTYADWGRQAVKHVKVLYTGCNAYAVPLRNEGIAITTRPRPFVPLPGPHPPRDKKPLVVWMHQWKDIKGIIPFLSVVPKIPGNVELYSTGIRYFQYRGSEIWNRAVGKDHWREGFDGQGKATYYGWIPLEETVKIYSRAWFSVGLQGITAKIVKNSLFGGNVSDPRSIYASGSYNNSETEALYYGAVPVLHKQVLKSDLPKDLLLVVEKAEELPKLLGSKESLAFASDLRRVKRARDWVSDNNNPKRLYLELKEALFS